MSKPRITFLPPDARDAHPIIKVRVDIDGASYGIAASESTSSSHLWETIGRVISDAATRKYLDMFHHDKLDLKVHDHVNTQ
jgi:hypothetical protein